MRNQFATKNTNEVEMKNKGIVYILEIIKKILINLKSMKERGVNINIITKYREKNK